MKSHAVAYVKWEIFRPEKGTGGVAVYDFGSNKKELHKKVSNGGTLWLITSTRKKKELRKYHLAYKLVNCKSILPEESIFSGRWKYVVRAQDWKESRHFGFNDATNVVSRLQFTSGKSMNEVSNQGLRLLSIPELNSEDITLLERFQNKIEYGRAVFLSYSREDSKLAEAIETELGKRELSVSRDVTFLKPGQEWAEALRKEVSGTDCFIVLISPDSAKSKYVRDEVNWALNEYEKQGLVKSIIPAVSPGGGWNKFPELHRFEKWDYPETSQIEKLFDRLADGVLKRSAKK
jgi:hypothetical protein